MIRVVHPGSGFHFLPILDPRIQGSKRHRIPDPQHCPYYMISKGSRQESLKILARELAPVQEISSQLLHAKKNFGLERVGHSFAYVLMSFAYSNPEVLATKLLYKNFK
jgi:hypothetical protein